MCAYQENVQYYKGHVNPDDIINDISKMADKGYEVTGMTSHDGTLFVVFKKYYQEEEQQCRQKE